MAKIEVFHNVNRDASFGLNTVFDVTMFPEGDGKRLAETPDERHELVKVFEYEEPTGATYDSTVLLEAAFYTFNVGSDERAAQYRERCLRSLSVGDVVKIDGSAYSCESVGWDPAHSDDLRVVTGEEAEKVIRDRFSFGPREALAITVPLPD